MIKGAEANGMEPGDGELNITVKVGNSVNLSRVVDVTLNITNSSGVIYSSTHTDLTLPPNSSLLENFTIDTSSWSTGEYELNAYVISGSVIRSRSEEFVFDSPTLSVNTYGYMCNQTTETFNVTITSPFLDPVTYNITPLVPQDWSITPSYRIVRINSSSSVTLEFNITSSNSQLENILVNTTLNYTYPGTQQKGKQTSTSIKNGRIPILEVIREIPSTVSNNTLFHSRLVVHNKGCYGSTSSTLTERISSGWTPSNPSLGGSVDLINNIITWNFGYIGVDEYKFATYDVKSYPTLDASGTFRWNLTWDSNYNKEGEGHTVRTVKYMQEDHIEFDLIVSGSWEERSAEPNVTYQYQLKAINVGDKPTTANEWNATINIPADCNLTDTDGSWNPQTREVTWYLPALDVYDYTYLNFSMNCSKKERYVLEAYATRDTTSTQEYTDDTSYTCTGSTCSTIAQHTFQEPDQPYQKMTEINFYIYQRWNGYNLTIGEGSLNISDDSGTYTIMWQNYSFTDTESTFWRNYSLTEDEQDQFQSNIHSIGISSHTDAMHNPQGNITITKINYIWKYGKAFRDPENLFIKIKPHLFPPIIYNGNVTPGVGGWGETFNFTVQVYDKKGRDVTVYAYYRHTAGQPWSFVGSQTYSGCTEASPCNVSIPYDQFTCGDMDVDTLFMFNASNEDGVNQTAGTANDYFEIEADDVNIDNITPMYNAEVNRSQDTQFVIRAFDRDNLTYPTGSEGLIYITTTDVATYDSGTRDAPFNSTGHLTRTMGLADWGCSGEYPLGAHRWKGNINDGCYKSNMTPYIPFVLKGQLSNSISHPLGTTNFTRGTQIIINGSVVDDCSVDITGASVYFNLTQGNQWFRCPTIGNAQDLGGGYYTCTFDSTDKPLGWYNVTMHSSKTNYFDGLDVQYNAFFLSTVPLLDNPQDQPDPVPWDKEANFTIYVTDEDNETATVRFWLKKDGDWEQNGTYPCVDCDNQPVTFYRNFTRDEVGTWYYKFNTTDTSGNINTTSPQTITIRRHYVSILYGEGNNSDVNRSSTVRLSTYVYDHDNQTNTTDISTNYLYVYITNDSLNYIQEYESRNSTHYYIDFTPNCTYSAGQQKWKMNITSSPYYANNTSSIFYLNIYAFLSATFNEPDGTQNFTQGNVITFNGTVFDECSRPVTDANVYFNISKSDEWHRCPTTGYATHLGNGFYQCDWDSSSANAGFYNVTIHASKPYHYNSTDQQDSPYAFFMDAPVVFENESVYPTVGGWGRIYNFSVFVTHYTDVYLKLWTKKGAGDYFLANYSTIPTPSNTFINYTRTYTCSDVTSWRFKFNATDANGGGRSETAEHDFYIEDDMVTIGESYAEGNGSQINRTYGTGRIAVDVNDTDRNLLAVNPSALTYFNITRNGNDFVTEGYNTTNTSGYSPLYFSPTCTYEVGPQVWKVFTADYLTPATTCYKNQESQNFTLYIIGSMVPVITSPNEESFHQKDIVNITVNITDDCHEPVIGANLTFAIDSGTRTYYCYGGNVTDEGNGNYTCHWNSTGADLGWYDVTVNATKDYFNYNETFKQDTFLLLEAVNIPPELYEPYVTPNPGGWGSIFNFSVIAYDQDGGNVTVYLWYSNSTTGPWNLVDNDTCIRCDSNTTLYFNTSYTCSDIGTMYYFFNATDWENATNTSVENFTIERDEVVVQLYGSDGQYVNREGSETTPLILMVNDTTRNNVSVGADVNMTIWVTYDRMNFDSGENITTFSNGTATRDFDPTCSPLKYLSGVQYWFGGTYGDECYKDANSSNYTVNVVGSLKNYITSPLDEVYYDGENATLRGDVKDECGDLINDADVSFRVVHGIDYWCEDVRNEGNGTYNCTWNVTGYPGGYYDVVMNSSRSEHNPHTNTTTSAFFHEIYPKLENVGVSPGSQPYGTNSQFTFSAYVTDDDDTVNVSLWIGLSPSSLTLADSVNITDPINHLVQFQKTYSSCDDIHLYYWKINVTDKYGLSNQSSVYTFEVTKRNIYFVYNTGNGSWVSRVGDNSTKLAVNLKDAYDGSSILGKTVDFYVTTSGFSSDYVLSGNNGTGANGYVEYNFNPGCTAPHYDVGKQHWKAGFAGSTCYFPANSSVYNLTIYSELYATIVYPEGQAFAVNTPVPIWGDVVDECSNVTGATVNFRIKREASTYICSPDPATDLGNGTYRCSWSFSQIGWNNVTMNASKEYYNDTYTLKINAFELRNKPELRNPTVDHQSDGWGYNYTFKVEFRDADSPFGDTVNITMWKSYDNSTWIYVDSQNASYSAFTNVTFYETFTCEDYKQQSPYLYYKFTAVDLWDFTNETQTEYITLEKDNVLIEPITFPGISMNREGDDYIHFIVRINDTDKGNIPVPAGVNGSFWITYSGTNDYDSGYFNSTNSSGFLNYYFNATCDYSVGQRFWKAGTYADTCYEIKNMSTPYDFYLYGQLKNNLDQPPQGAKFNVTDRILINFTVSTDCVAEGLINETNPDVNLTNGFYTSDCSPVNDSGDGRYNCTWDSTGEDQGNWSIIIKTSKNYYNSNTTVWTDRFELLNRMTNATNLIVTPPSGGWGRDYTFNVTVSDPDGDLVNCTLYVNTTGTWEPRGWDTVLGSGNCSVTVSDFDCGDMGTAQFKFEIRDAEPSNTYNTSVATGPVLGEDSVIITEVSGDGSTVNRYLNDYTPLTINIYDNDRGENVTGANATIWITYNHVTYDSGHSGQTSSGLFTYNFDPTCSPVKYEVGNQTWIGGIFNDECYVDTNLSTNYTVTVIGDIFNTVIQPTGEEYLRGSNITISVNVTSDCSDIVDPDYINITTTSLNTNETFSCSPIEGSSGLYNCTFNTSSPYLMPARGYNITTYTNKTLYNPRNSTIQYIPGTSGFFIETEPILSDPWTEPPSDGWGVTFYLKVNVTDFDLDDVTVYAWIKQVTDRFGNPVSDDWTSPGSQVRSGINQTVSIQKTFTNIPNDIGTWSLKFNATDDQNNPTTGGNQYSFETTVINFTVEKDSVDILYVAGNNTTVNRVSGSVLLKLRAVDVDDPNQQVAYQPAYFYVTTDASDNESWGSTSTPTVPTV